jgi:hypothetical protein
MSTTGGLRCWTSRSDKRARLSTVTSVQFVMAERRRQSRQPYLLYPSHSPHQPYSSYPPYPPYPPYRLTRLPCKRGLQNPLRRGLTASRRCTQCRVPAQGTDSAVSFCHEADDAPGGSRSRGGVCHDARGRMRWHQREPFSTFRAERAERWRRRYPAPSSSVWKQRPLDLSIVCSGTAAAAGHRDAVVIRAKRRRARVSVE